jgi:hypothetical protein
LRASPNFSTGRPEVRAAGRERFKLYRSKALEPQTHKRLWSLFLDRVVEMRSAPVAVGTPPPIGTFSSAIPARAAQLLRHATLV